MIERRGDPLADPESLIRRVYAYVAYRLGDEVAAEDVTSDVFERAVRYRSSYDSSKGPPIAWLIGIARRSIEDSRARSSHALAEPAGAAAAEGLEEAAVRRLYVAWAVSQLDRRDRELIALRYGADLSAAEIGSVVDLTPNAVKVALHRARERLRSILEAEAAVTIGPRRR